MEQYDATAFLQEILDRAGSTDGRAVVAPGDYYISKTLVIHSNTTLSLMPGARIHLADHANFVMLENDMFCGTECEYNQNITIEGGVWDGNNVNQDRRSRESRFALKEYDPAYYFGICLRMRGVRNFTFRNVTIRNPESYGLQISDAVYFTVENVSFDYNLKRPNMDGIHIDGPARYGCVRNLFGSTNDDMVALNCDDGYACEVSRGGEIRDVLIDGLFADNGYTAVRLLSCGHMLENVIIRNIFGKYRFNVVSFTHHNVHADPLRVFKNVLIDGVFAGKAPQGNSDPLFWFAGSICAENITIQNVARTEEQENAAYTVQIDRGAQVRALCTVRVHQNIPDRGRAVVLNQNETERRE